MNESVVVAEGLKEGWDTASFRDPDGMVYHSRGRVFRALSAQGKENWERLSAIGLARRLIDEGLLVDSRPVQPADRPPELEQFPAVLEHQSIPFISYPYEWPFTLLKKAALTTLELLQRLFVFGLTLKDATPLNIQFVGTRPVLIDVTSIVQRDLNQSWTGYAQFCDSFLYPLMLEAYRGISFQTLLRGAPHGVGPAMATKLLGATVGLKPGGATHVLLRHYLERRFADASLETRQALYRGAIPDLSVKRLFERMERLVASLETPCRSSIWAGYTEHNSYNTDEALAKRRFVQEVCSEVHTLVWDLGANGGIYAELAAERGAYVIAMDSDPVVADMLARKSDSGTVLPLVVDLANLSPAQGWQGKEFKTLNERGRPDLVLCLALIHHLRISGQIPFIKIVSWLASLAPEIVLEFVGPDDPQTKLLMAGREWIYSDYRWPSFLNLLLQFFDIRRVRQLKVDRWLLHLVRRGIERKS